MVVISISIDTMLLDKFDGYVSEKGYRNRSEAFREIIRKNIDEWQISKEGEHNIAAVMVISEKTKKRSDLVKIQHRYSEIQTLLHTHLDDRNCLEIFIVKGESVRLENMIKDLRKAQGVKRVDFFSSAANL